MEPRSPKPFPPFPCLRKEVKRFRYYAMLMLYILRFAIMIAEVACHRQMPLPLLIIHIIEIFRRHVFLRRLFECAAAFTLAVITFAEMPAPGDYDLISPRMPAFAMITLLRHALILAIPYAG